MIMEEGKDLDVEKINLLNNIFAYWRRFPGLTFTQFMDCVFDDVPPMDFGNLTNEQVIQHIRAPKVPVETNSYESWLMP